jgi:hypothetical protein
VFEGNLTHYNSVGQQATDIILANLFSLDPNFKVLFFPCGHGRNLRHFSKFLNSSQIYASDIDESAIDFMLNSFHINALLSDTDFTKIKEFPKMNLIFVGSLITHLNQGASIKLIKMLSKKLKKNGLLILSSHGEYVASRLGLSNNYGLDLDSIVKLKDDYLKKGYGLAPYSYDPQYGISVISLNWFSNLAYNIPTLKLIRTTPKLWDNHHDVIVFKRSGSVKSVLNNLRILSVLPNRLSYKLLNNILVKFTRD